MVWWIPLAMAAANVIGGAVAKSKKSGKSKTQQHIRDAGGLDQYDPSVGQLRDQIGDQEGPAGFIGSSMTGFNGDREDWQKMLRDMGPGVAASLANTGAYRDIQNYGQYDLPQPEEYMQGYGQQAGQLAAGASQNLRQSRNALARRGLGNSAAMASLAAQHSQALNSGQQSLYADMVKASLAQRVANTQMQSQWAGRAFDVNQNIASMALGSLQAPREPAQKTNLWGSIASGAGAALGNYMALSNGSSSQQGNMGQQFGQGSQMDQMQRYGG